MNADPSSSENAEAYKYYVDLGEKYRNLKSLGKLSFDLSSPTGADIERFVSHMHWIHWRARCIEIDCRNRIEHQNELLKLGMTSSQPSPRDVEEKKRLAESHHRIATYMIPELTRIVKECEGQIVDDSLKGDAAHSLQQARDALEIFQRIPVSVGRTSTPWKQFTPTNALRSIVL
ncbi:hypothetical protein FRC00_003910 [Tulasnella sp. 408]|nr:hypothetical protein FRC00_003910 [Tulasnella sp. 408]